MINVDLIYEKSCPNIAAARRQLLRAFSLLQMTPRWREWDAQAVQTPEPLRSHGSPTILVEGEDVAGGSDDDFSSSCRLYPDQAGALRGTPSAEQIVSALSRAVSSAPGTKQCSS